MGDNTLKRKHGLFPRFPGKQQIGVATENDVTSIITKRDASSRKIDTSLKFSLLLQLPK